MAFPTSLARRARPDLASTNANQSAQPTNHLSFSPNASTRSPPGEKPRFVGATAATRNPDALPLFCLPRQPPPLHSQQQRRQQPVPSLPLRVQPPQNPRCAQDPSCHVVPRRARGRRAQLSPRARAGRWRRQGRPRRRRGTRGAEVVGPRVARRAPPADAWGGKDTLLSRASAW